MSRGETVIVAILSCLILGGTLGVLGWDLFAAGDMRRIGEWLRRRSEVRQATEGVRRRVRRLRRGR